MRVLFIERCLTADSVVFDQISRLQDYVEDRVIAVRVGSFPGLSRVGVVSVRCPYIPKLEALKSCAFSRAVRRGWRQLSPEWQPDLIHAHFAYPEGLAACRLGTRLQVPVVITGRGDDVLLYPRRNRCLQRLVSETLSAASGFIGVSDYLCQQARELGLKTPHVTTVPDGIVEEVFSLSDAVARPSTSAPVILFAGAFLPVKNVVRMIDAFARVSEHFPQARFRLAGKGPLETRLRQRLRQLGIAGQTEFLGQLAPAELAVVMRNSSLLCLPSVSEGWGNVITEAMACGIPVVGANVGGIPEQISSSDLGLLCDPLSVTDIADSIYQALSRTWDQNKLAAAGKRYTRADAARRIGEFYQQVLDQSCAE